MACVLTTGRAIGCYDSIGGIKAVYFADYNTLGAITYDLDGSTITTFAAAPEFFQFDLKGSASTYTETLSKDINNGTAFWSQSLVVQFMKLTKEMHNELSLIVYNSPHIIVEDYNGNYFTMGLTNGTDATSGTIVTGGARGDLYGYTLTFTAEEQKPANFLAVDIPTTTGTISAVQETP